MIRVIHEPETGIFSDLVVVTSDSEAHANIWRVVEALYPRCSEIVGSTRRRYHYPQLIRLTPVADYW